MTHCPGGGGDDSLYGGAGNDTILAEGGSDVIDAGVGNDHVSVGGAYSGEVGHQIVNLGTGDDTLLRNYLATGTLDADGGAGNDIINLRFDLTAVGMNFTVTSAVTLDEGKIKFKNFEALDVALGNGNDTVVGGALTDRMNGGNGNDRLTGLAGNDYITGGSGNDSIYGGAGADFLDGTDYYGLGGRDVIDGGADNDQINMDLGDTATGGSGSDTVSINLYNETRNFTLDFSKSGVLSLDANTKLSGFETLIYMGGTGKDNVTGGKLNDMLQGGAGNDVLRGGKGTDNLTDGEGKDKLFGDGGADILYRTFAEARDVFDGGAGRDTLIFNTFFGSAIVDMEKQSKNDGLADKLIIKSIEIIQGSWNDDDLRGSSKKDTFYGNNGDDVLMGRGGNDFLSGGGGDDWLTGGAGKDKIVFDGSARGGQGDVITDFQRGQDKLVLDRYAFALNDIEDLVLISGANPKPNAFGPVFMFETDNGRLWFDNDGNGKYVESELIATLQGVTKLSVSDFELL